MALIRCSECKHEVSDQAQNCPHCGVSISKKGSTKKNQAVTQIQVQPHYNIEIKKEKDKKVPMAILISITFVMLSASCLVAFLVSLVIIKFLLNYIRKHDFKVFGYYRIILGILILLYFFIAK